MIYLISIIFYLLLLVAVGIYKVNSVKTIFSKLNIDKHTVELMKSYYIKGMKHLDAVESKNKSTLIYFANKLMDRIS